MFLYGGAIANFGLALSIIWMLTSFYTHRVIQALHRLRLELDEPDPINDALNKATLWKLGYFSTFLGPTAPFCTSNYLKV